MISSHIELNYVPTHRQMGGPSLISKIVDQDLVHIQKVHLEQEFYWLEFVFCQLKN